MFKALRIFILLTILIIVAGTTYLTKLRATDWDNALWVSIYPINADQSTASKNYIEQLKVNDFQDIKDFLSEEGQYYKIQITNPVVINIAPEVKSIPPTPPESGSILNVMFWSLQLRYWAYKNDTDNGPTPDIKIYVVYNDPQDNKKLPHSLGLEKGRIGVVHAFAGRRFTRRNNVIVAHELLHTLGATDKYNLATGLPIFPQGFANPENDPLYPQTRAEIMAGRMAINEKVATFPKSLYRVVVGKETAKEINWLNN